MTSPGWPDGAVVPGSGDALFLAWAAHAPEGIFRLDSARRYRYANPVVERLLGQSPAALLGKTGAEAGLPAAWRCAIERLGDEARTHGRPAADELAVTTPAGICHLAVQLIPEPGPARSDPGLLGVIRDQTPQRQAEAAARSMADEIDRQRAFLRQIIDLDPNFIFAKDRQGCFVLVNQAVADAYGTTVAALTGKTDADVNPHPDEVAQFRRDDLEVLDTQQEKRISAEKMTDVAGRRRWLQTVKRPIVSPDGAIDLVLGVATDITARRQVEQALLQEKERAQVTLHSLGDAVITTDVQGQVTYLNPVAERLTAWSPADAYGQPLATVCPLVSEATGEPLPDPVARCLTAGPFTGRPDDALLLSRTGQRYAIQYSAAPIRGPAARFGAVLVFRDMTEARCLSRRIAHEAAHDALTGLVNRREFEKRLHRAVASANQYGAQHALCYLDLDHFKIINDTAGHAAGDEALKQVKALCQGAFRERDTFARLGGDEFGLLLEHCPLAQARVIAAQVATMLREHRFAWSGRTFSLGVSIGLVPITAATVDADQVLGQADIACYTAKELGRNRVHVYQPEDQETAQRHREILSAAGLGEALEQGRFRLHYQPIVALATPDRRPVRYEALLRLVSPGGREPPGDLLSPAAFIPAAERYGVMGRIDRWVIETAFGDYAAGIGRTGAALAVNLSGNSLSDDSLLGFIEAQFGAHAVPPARVCFEITETAAIQHLRLVRQLMSVLKRHGAQFALDDFGSGLSSFQYLKSLPVDYVKIDGGFVKDMLENRHDAALVAAIHQMSHTLGIQTIAEYVHSPALLDRVGELGVNFAQGYALGRPAPFLHAEK